MVEHASISLRSVGLQLILSTCIVATATSVMAQMIGPEAEFDRLQVRAEDAMANGDPESAAQFAGRAALQAAMVARKAVTPAEVSVWGGMEWLLRSQESGYRAVALFTRAGGQLPASTGVCGSLSLAYVHGKKSQVHLEASAVQGLSPEGQTRRQHLWESRRAWEHTITSLQDEYQCLRTELP